jgi:hypothetical protein
MRKKDRPEKVRITKVSRPGGRRGRGRYTKASLWGGLAEVPPGLRPSLVDLVSATAILRHHLQLAEEAGELPGFCKCRAGRLAEAADVVSRWGDHLGLVGAELRGMPPLPDVPDELSLPVRDLAIAGVTFVLANDLLTGGASVPGVLTEIAGALARADAVFVLWRGHLGLDLPDVLGHDGSDDDPPL